jgi:hypothetical protein
LTKRAIFARIKIAGHHELRKGFEMPTISMFYGILIYLYFVDNKRHKLPHIHARYQEDEVVIALPNDEILEGSLPGNKIRLVQAWVEIHRDELLADWELVVTGQTPYKIDPLR